MKKVFIIHGFEGTPNGGWKPWLMDKLAQENIWACALAMPTPSNPSKDEWVKEIARSVGEANDEIFLVGHSLGAPAVLRYLETLPEGKTIGGTVLVAGPCEKNDNRKLDNFLETPFNYEYIKSKLKKCSIIHGDDDPYVPLSNGKIIAKELDGELIIIPNGKHLNHEFGWFEFPQALEVLLKMIQK